MSKYERWEEAPRGLIDSLDLSNRSSFENIKSKGVGQTTILKFLEEHPEEINGIGCSMEQAKAQGIGRQIIASFLNWPESRVSYSLERLKMIGQLIQDGQRRGEIAKQDTGGTGSNQYGSVPERNTCKTLSDIGISRKES